MDEDRNTRYYHACAVLKGNKSVVQGLKDDNRVWCWDQVELANMALSFYKQLYTDDLLLALLFLWLIYFPLCLWKIKSCLIFHLLLMMSNLLFLPWMHLKFLVMMDIQHVFTRRHGEWLVIRW